MTRLDKFRFLIEVSFPSLLSFGVHLKPLNMNLTLFFEETFFIHVYISKLVITN